MLVDKAKLLEWLESEINSRWNHHDTRFGLLETKKQIESGTFDAPLTEEVRQLREERDELKWKLAHPVICQSICTSQLDDYCGQHMSNESCIACNAAWTQAHIENATRRLAEDRDKLVKALERIAHGARFGIEDVYASYILSEIKGTET